MTVATEAELDEVALRLRLVRLEADLEQHELARRIGVHRNTIRKTESAMSDPSFSLVARWASITGASLDWLATGEGAQWR